MSNIPNFNNICGTVVQSLAETIINREAVIVQLREENASLRRVIEQQNSRISAQWEKLSKCCNTRSDTDPQTGVQYGDIT